MKALIPDGHGSVTFTDVPEPVPPPGALLIKVEAFSVNRGETFLLEPEPPYPAPAGWRPGKDIAGLVVQAAADGIGPQAGQRVVAHPPAAGWAEYAVVPAERVAPLPDSIPSATAAALPLAGLTALRLLRTAGCVAGKRLLITGASGGVGHYFTELATGADGQVTAVTQRGHRLAKLGAKLVKNVTDAQGPFDVVLESVGGDVFGTALTRLAKGGQLIWFGEASRQPVTIDFFALLTGPARATITHFAYDHPPYDEDLAALVDLVQTGRLHPEIGFQKDWADAAEAITRLKARDITGNAVLTI
jgi:NADPH:quinone reductase-like Zn-dependent oxidoreductase